MSRRGPQQRSTNERVRTEEQGAAEAQEGKFDVDGNQVVGNITSKNALGLIRQWAQLNRAALDANWSKIKSGKPLERIPPLE